MHLFIISFVLGDIYIQCCETLPSLFWLCILIATMLTLCFFFQYQFTIGLSNYFLGLLGILAGIIWATWIATTTLQFQLPKKDEKQIRLIKGIVASLPAQNKQEMRFLFAVRKGLHNTGNSNKKIHHFYVQLTMRPPIYAIHVGDTWQFYVKLKRIHALMNPGGIDFENIAFAKNVRAHGYIDTKRPAQFVTHHWYHYPTQQIREIIKERIKRILPDLPSAPWLLALILGDRSEVNPADWEILRATGTNHLMAVGGLHIGFVTGFIYLIIFHIWRRLPRLTLKLPGQEAASYGALLTAFFYSACAGFSIPTKRALLMLVAWLTSLLIRKKINPWTSWLLAIFIVVSADTLVVRQTSFWLSFGTLALIIYCMFGRLNPHGYWWRWGRVQWIIAVGLLPFSIVCFFEFSLIGIIANTIAIPLLGFMILPFCLLSAIFVFFIPKVAEFLLWIAATNLNFLWKMLVWLAQFNGAIMHTAMPNFMVFFITILAIIVLLAPRGFVAKPLSIIFLLPLFIYSNDKPQEGDFWLTQLDVGQGLSVVIQTKSHVLVYDAGPRFSSAYDMGESVVLPFLYSQSIKNIDMLVVSHGDNDHMGGSSALIKAFFINSIKTSVPNKIHAANKIAQYCLANDFWEWDGVKFQFLYPYQDTLTLGNDSSCVLLIANAKHRVLLTGDIEKFAEHTLLERNPSQLAADILVAPHHGSKTSGLKDFIQHVHPTFVLYGIGYLNRYRFPHPSVVRSYARIKALQFNTAKSGAIQFKIQKMNPLIAKPFEYRKANRHYWTEI